MAQIITSPEDIVVASEDLQKDFILERRIEVSFNPVSSFKIDPESDLVWSIQPFNKDNQGSTDGLDESTQFSTPRTLYVRAGFRGGKITIRRDPL